MCLKNLELAIKHDGCYDACRQIRDRHAPPYSLRTPEQRKHEDAGKQEQQLPGEGQENGFARHPDALEEVGSNHLKADDGEENYHNAQSRS